MLNGVVMSAGHTPASAWGDEVAAAREGEAPEPVHHVIFRSTRRDDGALIEGYQAPDESGLLTPAALEIWLANHLNDADRLAVAVLVIREVLDARGLIRQCTIERRRGSAAGPYAGDPARVEFTGAAEEVRLYRSDPDGTLTEVPPGTDGATPLVRAPEQFAGEYNVLHARFGDGLRILDSRDPMLFEDLVGLSSIVHVRTSDGREVGCGIGWHGSLALVLEADFPRFGAQLVLSPEDVAAVEAAARKTDLLCGGLRLDEHGIAVIGRRRGGHALFLLRPESGQVRVEAYVPVRTAAGPDQQRWLRYAERYEGLTVLDTWRDGVSTDLIVLTGDQEGQLWRHHIDPDGVETWRKADDDAAIGALHRERLFPGTLAASDAMSGAEQAPAATSSQSHARVPRPDDSLLARAEAFAAACGILQEAIEFADDTHALTAARLRELLPFLEVLEAHGTLAAAERVLMRLEAGTLALSELAEEVARIEGQLRLELSLMRSLIVAPPHARLLQRQEAPYGAAVEMRFPSASYDIEEASVCVALRRPTAAVFHCMKVVERGVAALVHCAQLDPLPEGERDWQKVLRLLRRSPREEFASVIALLEGIRKQWRAPSLLPCSKYTESEAEKIVRAVGDFMRALSVHCDENGTNPVADENYGD
jgi:hypothetical protein